MIELRENAVRIKNGKQSKLNEICNNQVYTITATVLHTQ